MGGLAPSLATKGAQKGAQMMVVGGKRVEQTSPFTMLS